MNQDQGMHNFRELNIWQKSKQLAIHIYKITSNFPTDEKFGLIAQIRRASISVPANIAEGAGRKSKKDFSQFINIALGSLNEVSTFLEIAKDLNILDVNTFDNLEKEIRHISNMLGAFNKALFRNT